MSELIRYRVPESAIFKTYEECFAAYPEDPAVPMIDILKYDTLKRKADAMADAFHRFTETMRAINEHRGYEFSQPLINASKALKQYRGEE